MDHLRKIATNASKEYNEALVKGNKHLIEKTEAKRNKITELTEAAIKNKDKYVEYSKEDCRLLCYEQGVDITYVDERGGEKIETKIHYKMLFRSTGKAKKGVVTFINERLYEDAHRFLCMGLELPEENAPIVEVSAYMPLVASGIVGRIQIKPENILILREVERGFNRDIVSVEIDKEKRCVANWIDDYRLKNALFDGQALIDDSVFPDWASGYVLLRHHFTKMAAFHTNIQLFFKDWCAEHGKNYETYTVKDMFGNKHRVKDIQMITTENATKWTKFVNLMGGTLPKAYKYWSKWVHANDCNFGVVKFSHPSKLGDYQKMSYQMVNSLDESIMKSVCDKTLKYIKTLKDDNEEFMKYLAKNINFSNDFDVLIALYNWNPDFARSSYFKERKYAITNNYLAHVKTGELIQEGDNLVIVGSPYALLLYAASGDEKDCDKDNTFCYEEGTIQVYTPRFKDDEYLIAFRSPFNGRFNMNYLHNKYSEIFDRYFKFSEQIIAVNMIGTDFQDRNFRSIVPCCRNVA